ncbi:hypothetical protein LAC81_01920 [Ensifer adhaerens]|uniref:hypothetical protein n=1 Tax=Ensifer adhaerens TaxID=106592 RepID=UPI001CBEEB1D|nr:hypothetical protein [Ensifer adhaerens]MBZ7920543.1 hypothetical protein [Ensifer adhaerens]UAX93019.1 hypothetical protein LAC78_01915 [Ensifer adhaerens]UAY00655.1 hypothetical protein LAC80_01920 [Ensifer adhaerens]UAY08036.1 hypothetical protein LAC81_01920 [Ensifer adhaerens]
MEIVAAITAGISAALWFASSFAWLWAVQVKAPLVKGAQGVPNAIVMSDGPRGEISFGGTKLPNFEELNSYNKEVGRRNRIAAYVSAGGAFFSGVSAITAIIALNTP